jgi:hypothetical protein
MFLGVALRSLGSRRMQAKSKERVRDAGYSPRRSGPESLKRARRPTSASRSPPMRTPSAGDGRHGAGHFLPQTRWAASLTSACKAAASRRQAPSLGDGVQAEVKLRPGEL